MRSFTPRWRAIALTAVMIWAPSLRGQGAAKALTIDEIFGHGPLTGTPPSGLAWSPDAQHLTYLDGGELVEVGPGVGKPHILVGHGKLATLSPKSAVSEEDKDHRRRYGMPS